MSEPSFSIYEFKDWMSKQDHSNFFDLSKNKEDKPHEYIGEQAFAKVSKKKLMKKAVMDEDDLEEAVDEFIDDGGIVTEVNGKMLLIEVGTNSISLPRFCVKIKKSK